ncbi:MAG: hypothetical protein M3394_07845, partial [Actinomycetota bacterium]|nr:hypothetical protein [Actinomycetota bacterium]
PAQADLVADLRDLAGRVRVGDGPQGPALGDRLQQVASEVEAGGGAQAATALLADLDGWHRSRQVFDKAATEATALLLRVPGAEAPTTTVAPTTQPPTTQPPADEDDEDAGVGKGKKKRGDD